MKKNRFGKAAIFKPDDIKKLRKAFNLSHHRCILEIALYTGERMGAIVQLQVDDVYSAPGVPREIITFRARTRKARPDGTRETRQIISHQDLISYLANYEHPVSGWLFPGRAENKHITYDSVYQYWQDKFLELGMDHRGFSCHSTRRWFITELVRSGTHPKVIQKITGHKSLNIVMDYADVSDDTIKDTLAKIAA